MTRALQFTTVGLLVCAIATLVHAQPRPSAAPAHGAQEGKTRRQRKGTPARCVPEATTAGQRHGRQLRRRSQAISHRMAARLPAVTRFAPAAGVTPTTVRIFGSNFAQPMRVTLNGQRLRVTRVTPTRLTVEVPAGARSGHFKLIRPGLPRMIVQPPFEVLARPRILSARPQRVLPGDVIIVKGRGFRRKDRFLVAGQLLEVLSFERQRVQLRAPAGPLRGRLSLMRRGEQLASWSRAIEIGQPAPRIAAFDPLQGGPGTVVRLRGEHFAPTDRLWLAGRPLKVRRVLPQQIEVVIGARHRSGRFTLRGRRGRRALGTETFRVIRAPRVHRFSPQSGLTASTVRVYGRHFAPSDQLYLGNVRLEVIHTTPKKITAKIPETASSGRLSLRRGSESFFAPGSFAVVLPPRITRVTPLRAIPGTVITIEGTGLTADASVRLNGRPLRVLKRRVPRRLKARIPRHATSGHLIVTTRRGAFSMPQELTVLRRPQIRRASPQRGPAGTAVTLAGRNFHPEMNVYLGATELPLSAVTPTRATAIIPDGATSGRLLVRTRGAQHAPGPRFKVTSPAPQLSFTMQPERARPGQQVVLTLTPPTERIRVYLAGRELPTRVTRRGRRVVVTVPDDARSGLIQVEYRGRRYRSPTILRIIR